MEQLLTIAGTVAAVQMLLAAWREWRSARRIVAVGGLDADFYTEHGCVPLQFAGSRFGAVRAVVAVTGFFMVRPTTPKQVFAVRDVVGMRGSSEVAYQEIRPRDRLRVMLDEGEYRKVFDRSMRRGVVSFYRTVAIRELTAPGSSEQAHCVTVRTRGSVVRSAGDAGSPWLEYAVTAAAPRSNRRSGQSPLADVPEDAVELVIIPPDTYQRARHTATERRDTALRGWLMRRNPSPIAAAAHFVTKYTTPVAAVVVAAALYNGSIDTSAVVFVLVLPAVLIAILLVRFVVPDALKRRLHQRLRVEVQPAETTDPTAAATNSETIPLQYFIHAPPGVWTGATAHCMSAGRRVNATDARSMITHVWRQFSYGLRQFLP